MAPTAVEARTAGDTFLDASPVKQRSASPLTEAAMTAMNAAATSSRTEAHDDASSTSSSSPYDPAQPSASTSKRTLEEEEDEQARQLFPGTLRPKPFKKRVWRPTKHETEPPGPPQPDPKTVQEMAAQQAATELGYEGRRIKKFMQRRTVDYWGSFAHYTHMKRTKTSVRSSEAFRGMVYPSPHQIVNLLLPAAYDNISTSITKTLVHTSTNKIRCPVNVVKWMPDGRRLLTGSTSGEFTLWNGLTFNFETIMQAHDSAVRSFCWSKSGNFLISSDQNGTIKYFQSNLNTLQAFQGHPDSVRGLAWSPDDTKFVSGSDDSTLKIWDFNQAKPIKSLQGHGWDVKCVDWHATKGLLVSGSKDNLVKFWDPRTSSTNNGTCLATFHGHKNTVQSSLFSPDGNLVATASRDQTVKVYDLRSMNELITLKGHSKEVCSLDFHPTHHNLLVSGGSEGSILFWDLSNLSSTTTSQTLEGESKINTNASTGNANVGGGAGGGGGMLLERMDQAHESNVWSLAWHPFGHLLCSGSNDHMTRFWSRARPDAVLSAKQEGAFASQYSALAGNAMGTNWGGGGMLADTSADDSFIPGLGTAKSFIPPPNVPSANGIPGQPQPSIDPSTGGVGETKFEEDDFAIPGLSFGSRPQPPPTQLPPQHQQQGLPQFMTNKNNPNLVQPQNGHFAGGWQQRQPPQPPAGGAYGSFY